MNHLLDIFFLEVVAQNDGQDGGGELKDLSGVHWALELFCWITRVLSFAEVEKVLAEVVSLLEESLLSEVVLDVLKVTI